jgi:hypothetical protein
LNNNGNAVRSPSGVVIRNIEGGLVDLACGSGRGRNRLVTDDAELLVTRTVVLARLPEDVAVDTRLDLASSLEVELGSRAPLDVVKLDVAVDDQITRTELFKRMLNLCSGQQS